MLSEISGWWVSQMRELLPQRWRNSDAQHRDALILGLARDDGSEAFTLSRRARGRNAPLGRYRRDAHGIAALRTAAAARRPGTAVILELPPALLLEREVTMPVEAETALGAALGYEMDRLTPFTAAELYWSWSLLRRDRVRGQLHVRLSMIRRVALVQPLESLAAAGLSPDLLLAPGSGGAMREIALGGARAAARHRRRAVRLAATSCAVLACAVAITPILANLHAIAAADDQIAGLAPRVAVVEALRRRIAVDRGGVDGFAAAAAQVGNPLQAIAALTDILPDDTWLTGLSLHQRVLTFSGQSAGAARLIPALSADPRLRNPSFVTPVTRADAAGTDLFSIRAELGL